MITLSQGKDEILVNRMDKSKREKTRFNTRKLKRNRKGKEKNLSLRNSIGEELLKREEVFKNHAISYDKQLKVLNLLIN
jgi:hypothetical protein